jgi:hypothetical protein
MTLPFFLFAVEVRKAQHKECEIAKCDRNDNRIKRQKAGKRNISSNEDPLPEPSWSGNMASAAVDWSDMSGSSTSSPPRATEVTSLRWPETSVREKNAGSSSRSADRPAQGDQQAARPRMAPGGSGASEARRDPPRRADPPSVDGAKPCSSSPQSYR